MPASFRQSVAAIFLLLLGAASALRAQQSPAQIEGIVIDSTGSPVRKAYVSLSTIEDHPAEALAITDGSGRFGFANVPPGRYNLSARCDGYQDARYGALTPRHAPGVLTLHSGERRQDVTLRLVMLGAISGTVLDPDGDPVDGAEVSLWMPWFPRGKPGFTVRGETATNERGEYRFSDVLPGRYLVMVNAMGQQVRPIRPESDASAQPFQQLPQVQFGIQYFANAERVPDASLLTVVVGKEIEGIDFHLAARPAAALRGTVTAPGDLPNHTFVQINGVSLDTPNPEQGGFVTGTVPPKFEFSMDGVSPGDYLLVANAFSDSRRYRGVQRLVIAENEENHAAIKLDPGIDLAGTVKIEGQKLDPATRVLLSSGDDLPFNAESPEAPVKADGTFVISGVVPGIWDINVQPIPEGGYIKSMRLGRQDVLTEDMLISSDTTDHLDIVVSTRGGILVGDVKTESGDPAGPVYVLAAPDGQYSNVLSFYESAASDEKGHFKLSHLTPGHYKLYAFEALDYCAWCDPDFLKPFAHQGHPVEIAEGMNPSVEIRLIHNAGKQP